MTSEYGGFCDVDFHDKRDGFNFERVNIENSFFRQDILHVLESINGGHFWSYVERIPYKAGLKLDLFVLHALGENFRFDDGKVNVSCGVYKPAGVTMELIEESLKPVVTNKAFPTKEYPPNV